MSPASAVLIVTGDRADAKPIPVTATELTLTTMETKTADSKALYQSLTHFWRGP